MTPRRTRLVRVADLQQFRHAIIWLCEHAPQPTVVLVPTSAARSQFERTWQAAASRSDAPAPLARPPVPTVVTRDELYELLHRRLPNAPPRLGPFERRALTLAAAARAAASAADGTLDTGDRARSDAGGRPPFTARPGLVAEMFRFYDELRRQSRRIDRFQELIEEALGGARSTDSGIDRTLAQTRLLAEAFREYERRVVASGRCDEHSLRERLLETPLAVPLSDVLVTVADWIAEPDGLFVSDFDLLARMPGVERVDMVCTEHLLGSGFHQRLHDWWPGLEEVEAGALMGARLSPSRRPLLETPADPPDRLWFTLRDRQEELTAVAQRIKAARRHAEVIPLDRVAIVFKKPLPYLYLADVTLGASGIPYTAYDRRPLASWPMVGAIDLVLEALETNCARAGLVALLRTPHFVPWNGAERPARPSLRAFDTTLRSAGYLGDRQALEAIERNWQAPRDRRALDEALAWVRALEPLTESLPASVLLHRLRELLAARLAPDPSAAAETGPDASIEPLQTGSASDTVLRLLAELADAHAAHDDPVWTPADLTAAVRALFEGQTFSEARQRGGVQLLDDRAARYGDFDDLTIVGLTDADWPERQPRNVFYPTGLLKALGWPLEHTRRSAADARFLDLLASPTRRVAVTTIALDDDAIAMPAVTLDEMPRARLSTLRTRTEVARLTAADALSAGAVRLDVLSDQALGWATLRLARTSPADPRFHGSLGSQPEQVWSVSALEVYLACPFKFYAQHVLHLEADEPDSDVMDPRQQGLFVHAVFQAFFERWNQLGGGTVTPASIDRARAVFTDVVDTAIAQLPPAEAGLERTRLLGSSAAGGLGEAVLRMEAERPVAVVERLLEHRLDGPVTLQVATESRTVRLRGKADRIDLLEDGTFRLIDYKLGRAPNRSRALQLPIYALAATERLSGRQGRSWSLGEAAYVAFKGPRRVIPLVPAGGDRTGVLAEAGARLTTVVDAIARGEFPPRPDDVYLCERCNYAAVCRKDYVGDV